MPGPGILEGRWGLAGSWRHSAPQCLLEGLLQPPDSGKEKLAPSVCPPIQPSPSPTLVPQCHSCSSPAHTSLPMTSSLFLLLLLLPSGPWLGHGWASQLALAHNVGGAATGGCS